MKESQDLIHRINTLFKEMSKGQKLIAEYILNNYDKAAFMTASKLGKQVGVSESTVVRFANALDYEGYPQLQKALQELVRNKLTTIQRIQMTSELDQSTVIKNVMKADMNNIRMTIDEIDSIGFEKVVERVFLAENLYVLGLRSAAPLAEFMGYYLSFMFSNVRIVTSGVNDIFEQVMHIKQDDLLIGISFPRYARRTIEAMEFAKSRGTDIVAITDSYLSPLTSYADFTLLARSDMASFVDSLVAPMSLINALIVAISLRHKEDIFASFAELEDIWSEYNVYVRKKNEETSL